ncbi:MAG: hypothetical protein M3P84_05840 [Chloroflexota bacterium]|nr:hypothetical protein [Chloroflexota bacterium]
MAIHVLKGLRNRGASAPSDAEENPLALAIDGQLDGQLDRPVDLLLDRPVDRPPGRPRVSCSNCGRPLGLAEVKCAGCGAHVLAGVPLKRGAGLILAGSLGGLLVGSALAVVIALAGRPSPSAANGPVASIAPAVVIDPSASPSLVSGPVSQRAAAALKLTVAIEDRLAASATQLKGQVKAKSFNAAKAATTIRAIAADAALGSEQVDRLAGWPAAAPLRAQLQEFYLSVRRSARDALGVSMTNAAKYKQSAKRMINLLASIKTTRTALEALATANTITIPAKPAP